MIDSETVYTVSTLTREIKTVLEDAYPEVWVEGEIANYHHHRSGHRYFSLTDGNAQLRCVLFSWFSRGVRFEPEDGQRVRAFGTITVYEPRGEYQLQVRSLRRLGEGELLAAVEKLRLKLAAEGLFDEARKKPLPQYPRCVGVVTSPTGAAIRDILNVLARRWPLSRVVLAPVQVQGAGAPAEIVEGIERLDGSGLCDVMIIGRGGGSAEDLAAFSDEVVVRAVADSTVPVVSAVGHESDTVLSDFAADVRAPTPSAAAELVVPDGSEVRLSVEGLRRDLSRSLRGRVGLYDARVSALVASSLLSRPYELVAPSSQKVDDLAVRFVRAGERAFERHGRRVYSASVKLGALSPRAMLERGYAVVEGPRGRVRSVGDLSAGEEASLHLSDGRVDARVEKVFPK
jgi:exodeoxyribonuclease VII large subunit